MTFSQTGNAVSANMLACSALEVVGLRLVNDLLPVVDGVIRENLRNLFTWLLDANFTSFLYYFDSAKISKVRFQNFQDL